MSRIPILKVEDTLMVSIQVELHDQQALDLQEDILSEIDRTQAKGLLIDVTALEVVDSFLGRLISDTAAMARMMGTQTVLVGLRPAVAITLVELGLDLPGVQTALNVERGLALIRRNVVRPSDMSGDLSEAGKEGRRDAGALPKDSH